MATRGVFQLQQLRLVYSEHGGSSRTVRDYISSGRIIEWARQHPTVQVEVRVRNGKHPLVEGSYRTGQPKQTTLRNEPTERIETVMDRMYNSSGRKLKKLTKPIVTQTPSVQGVWTPMLDLSAEKAFQIEFYNSK